MKIKIFAWVIFFVFFLIATQASLAVMPSPTQVPNTKSHNQKSLTIPSNAVQVAPNVFSIGSAFDPGTGQIVDGFMILHPKYENAKSSAASQKPGGTVCYGYLASGAKWKTVEPWLVNATNSAGISDSTVFSLMQKDISKWEDATDGVVNSVAVVDVLGNGSLTTEALVADSKAPDDKNEVYFGSIADSSTIAVTTVWGIFSGPTFSRKLVEWDMVFNTYYSWSASELGNPNDMDFENISTHELGHAIGLADLYNSGCSEQTMYGYGTQGETKKRDLNTGDLQGVNSLY